MKLCGTIFLLSEEKHVLQTKHLHIFSCLLSGFDKLNAIIILFHPTENFSSKSNNLISSLVQFRLERIIYKRKR